MVHCAQKQFFLVCNFSIPKPEILTNLRCLKPMKGLCSIFLVRTYWHFFVFICMSGFCPGKKIEPIPELTKAGQLSKLFHSFLKYSKGSQITHLK
jgi:hypothetical protein